MTYQKFCVLFWFTLNIEICNKMYIYIDSFKKKNMIDHKLKYPVKRMSVTKFEINQI